MATWGIHHSSISVSDEEASLRFYRDGLGLKVVSEQTEKSDRLAEQVEVEGASVRCLWLETPGSNTLLELIIYLEPKGRKFDLAAMTSAPLMYRSWLTISMRSASGCGPWAIALPLPHRRTWTRICNPEPRPSISGIRTVLPWRSFSFLRS